MNNNHLTAMLNLINVASQRGAFRGEELTDVGTLYNAIKTEIESSTNQSTVEPELKSVTGDVLN